jgi:four helix bundle protein
MKENIQTLRERTKVFAVRVVRMYAALPGGRVAQTLGYQALRSGTSVGAHYREAYRSRSDAEIISKLETALQEVDETSYWFELLVDAEIVSAKRLRSLCVEANELTAILVASVKKIKARRPRKT